ncbi:response regulator [Leptolyngbya sp. FACHB-17]|uniref:response regulator n=1 Tax=unclassified Leptolyngbya TaxID=2650499 RepID=UPI0016817C93|nr:response regulator [Leptolyngbya sp. FACHB-17]MBD2082686.1 response regulator [Leptolyngbya sp. FACHB-17]
MARHRHITDQSRTESHLEQRPCVKVLLVEDNAAEARLLQEILKHTIECRFQLVPVQRMREAIALLESEAFDVVLLDLTLPDSAGLDSLNTMLRHSPNLPIVVLTNTNDDQLAIHAVRHGAQDYLVKRQINPDTFIRSIRYAIERKQAAEALREANDILEHRVQERTRELETANQRLQQEIDRAQKIQERLELAQKAAKMGSFEWNLHTQAMAWTGEVEALYGLVPHSFGGTAADWIALIHPDDRAKIEQECQSAIAQFHGLDIEFRILHPNGSIRWIAVQSSVFASELNSPRMLGIHMDITEKKQLEAQFFRAQRLESLGTLASGIAHDLNNILTPILAVTQLLPLKLPNLSDQNRVLLTTAETSARRGADLVKQILAFARGVEGRRVSLQLRHVLREIQHIIQPTFPKSIDLHTDIAPDLWTITGDATQIHQILMNLCVNARDAMPDGGALTLKAENVTIDAAIARLHLEAQVGAYVLVTVTDTGSGITPDNLQRIFDPFFTTKDIGKGTGLGLSALLGIVRSHGGFVDVHSQINQGSQFKIYLPATSTIEPPAPPDSKLLSGEQTLILIVDDEAAICETVQATLLDYDYQVLTAASGLAAIELLTQYKTQIRTVLLDLMMPSLDGFATLPLLRQWNPQLYAIAMSGVASTEVVAQAEAHGFQGFLQKPFTTQDLVSILSHDRALPQNAGYSTER